MTQHAVDSGPARRCTLGRRTPAKSPAHWSALRSAPLRVLAFAAAACWLFASTAVWAAVPNTCRLDYPSDAALQWRCHRIKPGETLMSLFGDRWQDVARFNRIDRRHVYAGVRIKVPALLDDIAGFTPMPQHVAEAEAERKFVLVDLAEQFLGAYEFGELKFSMPVAAGNPRQKNDTPNGEFTITAFHRDHSSSLYKIEKTNIPYPMSYALLFHTVKGVRYWLHGRDLPGYPASHGCIGLYDEDMQRKYYGVPRQPLLRDARKLYEWVTELPADEDDGRFRRLVGGPGIRIISKAPG